MSDPKTPIDEQNLETPEVEVDETVDGQESDPVTVNETTSEMAQGDEDSTLDHTSETEGSIEKASEDSESQNADPAAHDDVDLESGEDQSDEDLESDERGDPYGGHEYEQLKRILEGALFASGATLSVSHLRDMFDIHERPHGKIVRQVMAELIAFYEDRGMQLVEVASGYRFQTEPSIAGWISRLWEEKPQRYSRALMETIALIAYRQPITRGEIEDVRGVAVSSNIIRTLLEREWVRVVGHRDVPGRPAMYATTRQFLDYFGLKSLDQLPSLSEIRDMDELNPQMDLEDGEGKPEQDDQQSEISFSGMIDKLRESDASGKTGSEYIDDQLDGELAAMDEVNSNFEHALEAQRAEHEHPDLDLDEDEDDNTETSASDSESNVNLTEQEQSVTDSTMTPSTNEVTTQPESDTSENSDPGQDADMSEEEKWKIIQEKLAQQEALLEARESDQESEDKDNE
jgi:segregation and condensation protein B